MLQTINPIMSKLDMFATLWKTIPKSLLALVIPALMLTGTFFLVCERNYNNILKSVSVTRVARDNLELIFQLQTLLLNAETAQRGYLLSRNRAYLAPLVKAKEELPELKRKLALAFAAQPERMVQINYLAAVVINKFVELDTTVSLVKQGKHEEALKMLELNTGNALMSDVREKVAIMIREIDQEVEQMRVYWEQDMFESRLGMIIIAVLNLILLGCVIYLFMQDMRRGRLLVTLRNGENERLGSLVDERTSELNELSTHIQTSTERDRAALARDLHDELGGILTSVKMDLQWLRNHSTLSAEGEVRCDQIYGLLDDAVAVKRRVVENLRPSLLDSMGLATAIDWYLNEHCIKAGLACNLSQLEDLGVVAPDAAIAMFRIVQEAATNVMRHANAKNLTVILRADEKAIHLIVQDDGSGLPPTYNPRKLSHGLSGIRQRARSLGGDAFWNSVPGTGTTLTASIPHTSTGIHPTSAGANTGANPDENSGTNAG